MSMPKKDPALEDNPDEFNEAYEEDILLIEQETEKRVSKNISAIESAISSWKAAGKKSSSMKTTINQLTSFYNDLIEWEKKSLQKKENGLEARLKRLQWFVDICAKHKKNFGGAV